MQSSKTVKINGRAIVVSVIVGLAVTIILLLAISALMQRGKLNEASTGAALIVINIIAGISCGITARSFGREGGERKRAACRFGVCRSYHCGCFFTQYAGTADSYNGKNFCHIVGERLYRK